jgi:hypothetical protein
VVITDGKEVNSRLVLAPGRKSTITVGIEIDGILHPPRAFAEKWGFQWLLFPGHDLICGVFAKKPKPPEE